MIKYLRIQFLFAWYDLWIGFFWDSKKKWLYVLPLPMCGIIVKFPHVYKKSRCCGRCTGYKGDDCVTDQICEEHNEMGCEICFGKIEEWKIIKNRY